MMQMKENSVHLREINVKSARRLDCARDLTERHDHCARETHLFKNEKVHCRDLSFADKRRYAGCFATQFVFEYITAGL